MLDEVLARLKDAPLYRPVMPGTGKPFSVEESNFGTLGWVADKSGYRYQATHPVTGKPWPPIPDALLALWAGINDGRRPECCLVNLYRAGAKMGLHQDRDEKDISAAVIGVSLGDEALFRIGGVITRRQDPQRDPGLRRCDRVRRGGAAGLSRHRPDPARNLPADPGGGRLSLTLRRVADASRHKKGPRPGGRGLNALKCAREQPGGDEPEAPTKTGAGSERGAVPTAQAVFAI